MYIRWLFEQYAEDDMEIVKRFEADPGVGDSMGYRLLPGMDSFG